MSNPGAVGLQLIFVYRIVFGVPLADVEAFVRHLELLETTLPVRDPTRWMRERDTLEREIKVARAFLALRQLVEEYKQELLRDGQG